MPRIPDRATRNQPSPFRPARGGRALSPPAGMPPFWRPFSFFRLLIGIILPAMAVLLPLVSVHAAPVRTGTLPGEAPSLRTAIHRLLDAINRDRQLHSLPPLTLSKQQSRCSVAHSRQMARDGALSHDQFPTDICVSHAWSAENVGYYTAGPRVAVQQLHSMMMREGPCPQPGCPGDEWFAHDHYVNLMNPGYHRIGIGLVTQGGTTWLTEDFTN